MRIATLRASLTVRATALKAHAKDTGDWQGYDQREYETATTIQGDLVTQP